MFFQFSPIRADKKLKPTLKKETEVIETLLLTPFSQIPKLFFDNVKIGDTAKQKLLIRNTLSHNITVFINSTIPNELNVSLSLNQVTLVPNGEALVEIIWCPSSEISARYIITVEDFGKIKKDVPIAFKSVNPNKAKAGAKRNNSKSSTKSKTQKKSPTKKYYATKPPYISPKRFSPNYRKISPLSNKQFQLPIDRYPLRPSPPRISVTSPKTNSLFPSPEINRLFLARGKENISLASNLMSNISDNVFVSPNSAPFYLDHVKPAEQGRGTYILNSKDSIDRNPRRETYVLNSKADISPNDELNDSLENSTPLKLKEQKQPLSFHTSDNVITGNFEYQMLQLQSLRFSPIPVSVHQTKTLAETYSSISDTQKQTLLENNTCELPANHSSLNVSGQTYVKDTSFETYIKSNLSGGTYTKDTSIGNIETLNLSPSFFRPNSPIVQTVENATYNVNHMIERKQLSCIQEESSTPTSAVENIPHTSKISVLKRRSEIDYTFSPPKRPFIQSGPKDWSKKGSSAYRVAKHTKGLNLKNTDKAGQIAELTKTDTHKIIIQNPFLLAATNLVDPFMTPDLYINQQWIDQQEADFKKWLNALLSPPKEFASPEQTVDVAKVWQECKKSENEIVSAKEVCSNSNRLNNLRRAAQELFRSDEISTVLSKVCLAVDQGKLSIREDKDVHLNLSIKSEIMAILLSYNTLWLRIGLETIYNEIIPLSSNSDVVGISKFLVNRLLKDPYLIRKHKSVHTVKYTSDFKKFFLKKFFTLVYFLDQAKSRKLISHDPCLFRKEAVVKDSREILLRLAREILSAIGDITKLLKFQGYVVSHAQTYIHEFDYTVTSLGVDLRDGIRLTKVMEIILMEENLTSSLRVPAISRLQKVHNMKIVFESLKKAGYNILYDISPKDIVDGHREKTLSFLWQILYKFEAPLMVKSAVTIQSWFRSLPVVLKRRKLMRERLRKENAAKTIQRWYKRHQLLQKCIVFTKLLLQYLDMRKKEKAAVKIQAYFRMYACQKQYKILMQTITSIQVRCKGWLIRNVRRVQIQSAITIQKYTRGFLAKRRFLKLKQAAVYVQRKYRAKQYMKIAYQHHQKLKSAAIFIQRRFRANSIAKVEQQTYQTMKLTTIKIQQRFKANKLCKVERQRYLKIRSATICIQTWYRSLKIMRIHQEKYRTLKHSVLVIERHFIAYKEMTAAHNNFLALKSATLTVQRRWKATKLMKTEIKKYQSLKMAAVCVQQRYRAMKLYKKARKDYIDLREAAVTLQRKWKAQVLYKKQRRTFCDLKKAALLVQRRYRANKLAIVERNRYERLRKAALSIQRRWRAKVEGRRVKEDFTTLKKAAGLLQQKWRAKKQAEIEKTRYLALRKAAVVIQTRFKAKIVGCKQQENYMKLRTVSVMVQQRWRAKILGRRIRKGYADLKSAAVLLQRRWRAKKLGELERRRYLAIKQAAVTIQVKYKAAKIGQKERQYYASLRRAVITIQQRWRANKLFKKDRSYYCKLRSVAILVQQKWKANKIGVVQRKNYLKLLRCTLLIQRKWKSVLYGKRQRAYYISLKMAVIFTQRKWIANRLCLAAKTRFDQLRKMTLLVQQKWRAKKLGIKQRSEYVTLKNTAVFIQRRWRALKSGKEVKNSYEALRKASVIIQQKWRAKRAMKLEMQRYETVRKAAIVVQRRYRGNKMMKSQFRSYTATRNAIIFIQRRWRALTVGRETKLYYESLKKATLVIQQKWKAIITMRNEHQYYLRLKKAAIVMQRRYRSNLLMRKQRLQYIALKTAVMFVQRRWRALKVGSETRARYTTLRKATVTIQCRLRANREFKHYSALKKATLTVQRRFRANRLMKIEKSSYGKLKTSAIVIQKFYRGYKMMKKERLHFLVSRNTISKLQVYIRGFLIRRKYAYYFSAEAREQRRLEQMKKIAATKIQAFWRGFKCRQNSSPVFEKIRAKLKKADESATQENTLAWKSKSALQTITNEKSTLFLVIKALEDLDVTTRSSKEICERMAKLLPEQLYLMLSALTRSLPEMNAAIASVNILITFYKHSWTRKYSFLPEHLDSLITLMLHWCDKESMLFPITCTLLWLFAHNPEWKRCILEIPNFEQRFGKIQNLVMRKQNMVKRTGTKSVSSVFEAYKDLPLPSLRNDWGLNPNGPRTFTNSFHALSSLTKILNS